MAQLNQEQADFINNWYNNGIASPARLTQKLAKARIEVGTKVKVNGVEGRVTKVCDGQLRGMYEVRIFDGTRHVGDICTSEVEVMA